MDTLTTVHMHRTFTAGTFHCTVRERSPDAASPEKEALEHSITANNRVSVPLGESDSALDASRRSLFELQDPKPNWLRHLPRLRRNSASSCVLCEITNRRSSDLADVFRGKRGVILLPRNTYMKSSFKKGRFVYDCSEWLTPCD